MKESWRMRMEMHEMASGDKVCDSAPAASCMLSTFSTDFWFVLLTWSIHAVSSDLFVYRDPSACENLQY